MSETTLAVAKKCPKCNNTGTLVKKSPTGDPSLEGHVYMCETKTCLWGGTTWIVMVNDEGKVPVMDIGHEKKLFPELPKISPEQMKNLRQSLRDDET